jgi:hypothetical protein
MICPQLHKLSNLWAFHIKNLSYNGHIQPIGIWLILHASWAVIALKKPAITMLIPD